jgi:tRNA(fMet)-specific endonuclease VapC
MGVILDTSVLIEAERRELQIDAFTENREEEVFGLSVITVAELLHGVHRADSTKRRLKRSAYVERVIELFPVYAFEIPVARIYAELWSDLSAKGIQIGADDLIIVSTALSLGFSLATCNTRHFEKIEGLNLEILRFGKTPPSESGKKVRERRSRN